MRSFTSSVARAFVMAAAIFTLPTLVPQSGKLSPARRPSTISPRIIPGARWKITVAELLKQLTAAPPSPQP